MTKKLTQCRYLVKLRGDKGKSICNRWRLRRRLLKINRYIVMERDEKNRPTVICIPRETSKYDYPDCPYNTGDKPYPVWINNNDKIKKKVSKV